VTTVQQGNLPKILHGNIYEVSDTSKYYEVSK